MVLGVEDVLGASPLPNKEAMAPEASAPGAKLAAFTVEAVGSGAPADTVLLNRNA